MRSFVDTNLLVYAHDVSAGTKRDRAREIVKQLWDSGDGCLSVQVLQEFFVSVTRKVPMPLAVDNAARIVADLALWSVHAPGPDDVLEAIDIHRRARVSFWDAMIIHSASALSCPVLYSEDLNAGQQFDSVRVVDPFA